MEKVGCASKFLRLQFGRKILVATMSLALLIAICSEGLSAYQDPGAPPQDTQAPPPDNRGGPPPAQSNQAPPYAQQSPQELQQLVAPIALYPDSLVAQIRNRGLPDHGGQAK